MYDVKTVIELNSEGLTDEEIAKKLNCHRTTITRIRERNNIPKRNVKNRKDKIYICYRCKKEVKIARSEPRQLYCPECLQEERNEMFDKQ